MTTGIFNRRQIASKLQNGDHFGNHGSIALTRRHILPCAENGDVVAMMQVANTYYTVAAFLGIGNIFNKILAAKYLYLAKLWAVKAFLTDCRMSSLPVALTVIDVRLVNSANKSNIDYGSVHVLMASFAQWHKHFTLRLGLENKHDTQVIQECHRIIIRSASISLKILSMATLYELPDTDAKTKEECRTAIYSFVAQHYDRLMNMTEFSHDDRSMVQVVCRASRAIGNMQTAADLASAHKLGDQYRKTIV